MAQILPRDLTAVPGGTVNPNSASIVDDGSGVWKATPQQVVDSGAPINSKADSEAGLVNTGRMTPLRVKQAIDALGVSQDVLASSTGGEMVGFQRSDGIARNVGGILQETWRVTDFMTEAQVADVTSGTGAIDVTAAIQAAIDAIIAAGGGTLVFPKGMHMISDTLVVNTTDASVCVWFVGAGRNTIIRQTGAGKDAVRWSDANWLFGGGLRDLQIRCTATAGHCFNVGYGMANTLLGNVGFLQTNPSKSVIYGDFPNANAGGIIGCRFSGGVWYNASASTVSAVKIDCNGQVFGENIFENLSLYYATTVAFFDIGTKVGLTGYWLENNYFRNIYFELCPGGAFRCDTSNKWTFDGIRMWDTTSFTNHIFEFTAGLSGTEARAPRISNYTRLGGAMASGMYDIKIADGHDAVIDNIGMETAHSPKFDFGNKRVTVIGRAIGTFDNALSTMFVGNSTGGIRFRGAANGAYLNYYDEGTWTATLSGTGAAPTTPVTVSGDWTRIGRRVSASAKFSSVDTTGASGGVVISGLPFAVNASQEPVNVAHMIGMGTTAAVAKATASTISLYRMTSGTAIAHADGTPGPGKSITVSLEYIV